MKRLTLIIWYFLTTTIIATAQQSLSSELVDSIIFNTISDKGIDLKSPHIWIVKFKGIPKNHKRLIASQTYLINRQDVPNNSFLYLKNGYIVFMNFEDIKLHQDLLKCLIKKSEPKYTEILDSLNFHNLSIKGVAPLRITLDVVHINMCCFNRNCYKLKFEKIFPAGKAPNELLPVEHLTDGGYVPDPPYKFMYDREGKLLDEYRQMLVVKKPVKICLKK